MYDVSGQMGCPVHDGAAGRFGSTDPTIKKNQVYLRVKSVQLHVAYVHPAAQGGFIPKSISQKVHPIQVATRQITTQSINQSFTVPVSTVAMAIFVNVEAADSAHLRRHWRLACDAAERVDGWTAACAATCLAATHYIDTHGLPMLNQQLSVRIKTFPSEFLPRSGYQDLLLY